MNTMNATVTPIKPTLFQKSMKTNAFNPKLTKQLKQESSVHKASKSSFTAQHISKCVCLILIFNQSTKKYELNLQNASLTVSSFFERKFGSDGWLKITTSEHDIAFKTKIYKPLMDIAANGVVWNNKTWKYFCHKDNILYFFHETESIKIRNVRQSLGDIYSTKSIAKFGSRLSLGFSKTYPLNTLHIKSSNIHIIDDILSANKRNVMTDGCGYISVNLAKQIPYISGGWLAKNQNEHKNNNEYVLLVQCRIIYADGLAKGVLIANPNIADNEIHLRQSMIKIRNNTKANNINMEFAMIEINNTSTVGQASTLNSCFNIILSTLINETNKFEEYIDGLLMAYFQSLQEITQNPRMAFRKVKYVLSSFQNSNNDISDTFEYEQTYKLITEMILAGQNMTDPYLQQNLRKIVTKTFNKLLYNGRIPVECSRYLMGTCDPLNVLNENQVFIVANTKVTGPVLIARNPCCHPGDIRLFTAVNNSELHDFIGYYNRAKSGGIFFSIKGERAAADLLSNGDYDGDLFWICWDEELIQLFQGKQVEAAPVGFSDAVKWNEEYKNDNTDLQWELVRKSPMEFKNAEIDIALMTHFVLTNANSMAMRMSNKIWKTSFELFGLFDNKTMIASKCYFVALDAAKSGIKVNVPATISRQTKGVIFPYNKDFHKKKFSKQIVETNSVLMFVFEKVVQFKNEFENVNQCNVYHIDEVKSDINEILDEQLLSSNDNKLLIGKINEFDDNFTKEFAKLAHQYKQRKHREVIGDYDNFNSLKAIQYEYNNDVFVLKRKYKQVLKEYCIANEISVEMFATTLYGISYNKVFRSKTRNSYWIPWILCGNILNKIKAISHCDDHQNVTIISRSPKRFKSVLLHKR